MFLISVEKGKQRYNKATKGNQQADYPYKYQYDIRSSHWRHLPSYVFRQAGHWLGRLPPLSWVPYGNTTTVRQEIQSVSLLRNKWKASQKNNLISISQSKKKDWKMLFLRSFQSKCPLFKLLNFKLIFSIFIVFSCNFISILNGFICIIYFFETLYY